MQMSQSQRVEKSLKWDLSLELRASRGASGPPEGLTIALAPASEAWGSAASGLRQI